MSSPPALLPEIGHQEVSGCLGLSHLLVGRRGASPGIASCTCGTVGQNGVTRVSGYLSAFAIHFLVSTSALSMIPPSTD
jgi:hypothetical protein